MIHDNITDISTYLRVHANELGSRILELYPPLQSTTDEVPAELSTLLRTACHLSSVAILRLRLVDLSSVSIYSARKASAGSTEAARCAGKKLEASATIIRRSVTAESVGASQARTPNSMPRRSIPAA